ncbi:P-loop containing nucleoside triphosphate hydrolase protein, partial [Crepidotus variabilis]
MSGRSVVDLAAQHILGHLTNGRPLFVALQGPQGSGKSYLAAKLQTNLESSPHSLGVAVLSIDDLYLPHDALAKLAQSDNLLWKGRGLPGTHDVALGIDILKALKSGRCQIELPRFDKSLHNGEGDRLPLDGTGIVIYQPPPLDIVILEGWFVGFSSIPKDEVYVRWHGVWNDEREKLGLTEAELGTLANVEDVNEQLKSYEEIWQFFDVFIQLKAIPPASATLSKYAVVYDWRLQQEHNMMAMNGGKGMNDAAVISFVTLAAQKT